MAMSKEEQRESAKRIMEKCGPLTAEEMASYARLSTNPEEYPSGRVCLDCGEAFEKEQIYEHADHMQTHSPTAMQWANAHNQILRSKDKGKGQ